MRKRTYISESHRKYSEACQREVEEMSKHPLSHEQLEEQMRRNRHKSLSRSKFIFLDLDSTLNTSSYQAYCRKNGLPLRDAYGPVFDPFAILNLASILKAEPLARLVFLSNWNYEGFGRMKGLWLRRFLPGFVIGIAGVDIDFGKDEIEALGQEELPLARAIEVRAWLRDNDVTDRPYVILDGEADYGEDLNPHVVHVNPEVGLTDMQAKKAIRLLKVS